MTNAKLTDAKLTDATLTKADLRGANLSNTDLSGANLSGAKRWTENQLREADSLKGATMPDGQILKSDDNPDRPTFEEWLKSKGSGKDREHSGPS